jgi:hypothetical protein
MLFVSALAASAQTRPGLPRLGFDERLDGPPLLAAALDQSRVPPDALPLFVRIVAPGAILRADQDARGVALLDERVALYDGRKVPVLLALDDLPASEAQADDWRRRLRTLAARYRERVFGYQIGVVAGAGPGGPAPVREYAFFLKLASVELRSVHPQAFVVQAGAAGDARQWQIDLYREEVAPYLDGVVVDSGADAVRRFAEVRSVAESADPDAAMVLAGVALTGGAERDGDWLATYVAAMGEKPSLVTFAGTAEAIAAVLGAAGGIRDVLAAEVVTLDERSVSLALSRGGRDVTSSVPHRLLTNPATLSTYFVGWGLDPAGGPLQVELADQIGRAPAVRGAARGGPERVERFAWDPATKRSRAVVAVSDRPLVLAFSYEGGEAFVERVGVTGAPALTVAEIVARHQQAQAAQDGLYRTYVARAVMAQHFRASPTDAFDVVSDNRYYFDRQGVEWEELSWSLNGARWGADRPAFPLLQAEKVLSLPLDLRLDADYRYRLAGTERVGDRLCYVVDFDPVGAGASLYRGRVWIDAERFVRLRVRTVQTRLTAPIVSSEEVQSFEPVAEVGGRALYLFSRLSSRQIFLIAGRNLLVEKEVRFSEFRVDDPDFAERRAAARASDRIMYRDTDRGLRYLVKRGEERVVSDRQTASAKALAMGTTIDPSYDFPLPMFGVNYVDFDFLGGDSQLAMLFGGVLVLGNVQKPKLGGTPLDASVDVFAIAVPVNDQVFDERGERRGERVRSIPFSTGVNLGYQFTDFQKVTSGYSFRYDAYMRDEGADPAFLMPSRTATHGVSLAYEYRRAGYSLAASAAAFRRSAWAPWGPAGSGFDPSQRSYRRYTLSLSKDFHLDAFQRIHLNGAWFGGERLDRFSMYQFGLFDETRMHGVPGAGVRFPELALARTSYSFNVVEQYRLDAFFDHAVGRNPMDRRDWLRVTGAGVAVNLRAPWGTMLRADAGKSFLPRAYAGAGSVVVQVMLLKPL